MWEYGKSFWFIAIVLVSLSVWNHYNTDISSAIEQVNEANKLGDKINISFGSGFNIPGKYITKIHFYQKRSSDRFDNKSWINWYICIHIFKCDNVVGSYWNSIKSLMFKVRVVVSFELDLVSNVWVLVMLETCKVDILLSLLIA